MIQNLTIIIYSSCRSYCSNTLSSSHKCKCVFVHTFHSQIVQIFLYIYIKKSQSINFNGDSWLYNLTFIKDKCKSFTQPKQIPFFLSAGKVAWLHQTFTNESQCIYFILNEPSCELNYLSLTLWAPGSSSPGGFFLSTYFFEGVWIRKVGFD